MAVTRVESRERQDEPDLRAPEMAEATVEALAMDHGALVAAGPTPYLVLTPEPVICEVNHAYLEASSRERGNLMGRHIFDAFPDNPEDPNADEVRNLNNCRVAIGKAPGVPWSSTPEVSLGVSGAELMGTGPPAAAADRVARAMPRNDGSCSRMRKWATG